jgi:hypothetical protein
LFPITPCDFDFLDHHHLGIVEAVSMTSYLFETSSFANLLWNGVVGNNVIKLDGECYKEVSRFADPAGIRRGYAAIVETNEFGFPTYIGGRELRAPRVALAQLPQRALALPKL